MNDCRSEGELKAFLDGELPAERRKAVQSHLDGCAACREEAVRLAANSEWIGERLAAIGRKGDPLPAPARAYARLEERLRTQQSWRERIQIMAERTRPRWRPALVALALVVVLVASFSLEPVRVVASDFLSIFRVQSFTVIPLGPEQEERMEELSSLLEQNFFLSEPVFAEEPREWSVDTAEEASAAAGFAVRTLAVVPEGYVAEPGYHVTSEATGQLEVDLEQGRSLFEMVGLDPALLPDSLGEEPLGITIAPLVTQRWTYSSRGDLVFIQGESPSVDFPEDVDPAELAQAAFLLLGMDEREARRLSESIDWTNTLAVPVPTDLASFGEVEVDGATGLLLTQQAGGGHPSSALMWEKGGILHFIEGSVSSDDLMEIAASIR